MKIVADENIPLLQGFFAELGDIVTAPGRRIDAALVKDADVLLVRSVTKVNAAMLAGSAVKFVGTCTIGTDHIDQDYLAAQNIRFASAPGCNANGVMNYVLSALLCIAEYKGTDMQRLSVGILGVGNVGRRLLAALEALDMQVFAYDPFVEGYQDPALREQVMTADVVTLHVPLTSGTEHATRHMFNAQTLKNLRADACLINASRGEVVDNRALSEHLKHYPQFQAVLDVWENEPSPDAELMQQCLLATPHIAGYSQDGKWQGTAMIYQALNDTFGFPHRQKLAQMLPEPALRKMSFSAEAEDAYILKKLIRASYDIRDDDLRMRSLAQLAPEQRALAFDLLRKHYPERRDFNAIKVSLHASAGGLQTVLSALGFRVKSR